MMKLRITATLLTVLMLFAALASCSDNTKEEGGQNNADTAAASETEIETEVDLYADLPTGNYDGYNFRAINNTSNFALTTISSEEMTGEPINDAIFNRNSRVSEALNITITEELVGYEKVTSTMNTCITAGDDAYDVFWNESHFQTPFAENGYLVTIDQLTGLNLDKPWWYKTANDSLCIGDKQYFLVGDLHLMFKESYWIVGFNKEIIDENSLEDPYELVNNGTWTLDKMHAMIETAAQDLNGDGQMTGDDQFGATCYSGSALPLLIGSGTRITDKNSDGALEFTTSTEAFLDRYLKIASCIYADSDLICMDGVTKDIAKYTDGWHGVFSSGHALFYFEPIGSLKKLRDMDAEFGVVPYPKYDDAQDSYYSLIAAYASTLAVPVTNSDLGRTGVILENLCAESYDELRQAYSKTTLNFKYIRDEESAEMLELIFNTGSFELASVYEWASLASNVISKLALANENPSSTLAKLEKKAVTALADTTAALSGN